MTDFKEDIGSRKNSLLDREHIEMMKEFCTPEELYQDLVSRVKKYHPSGDVTLIEKAYRLAEKAHVNQFRKSGEPYIIHPLCVAIILADLELDKETIVAGLLHDVVEDTILTDNGNRAILTFSGDSPFILVEEVSYRYDDLEIIPVNGDPLMLADSIGAISNIVKIFLLFKRL